MYMYKFSRLGILVSSGAILLVCRYMIKTQTLVTDKTKTYISNPKAATFQRKIAAASGWDSNPRLSAF